MNFDINNHGLIILNQYKAIPSEESINHYWYISTEGIEYLENNIGVLKDVITNKNSLLELVINKYKSLFEFTFDKVDLGFFYNWACLEIHMYSDKKRNYSKNAKVFIENLGMQISFDQEKQLYSIDSLPQIKTQYDLYLFINECISHDLNELFKPQNVAQCSLGMNDYTILKNYKNKIEFLEKYRFKTELEESLIEKKKDMSKKTLKKV